MGISTKKIRASATHKNEPWVIIIEVVEKDGAHFAVIDRGNLGESRNAQVCRLDPKQFSPPATEGVDFDYTGPAIPLPLILPEPSSQRGFFRID
jgi:hypothetical protein